MKLNFTRQQLPMYIRIKLVMLLSSIGLSTSLFAQSGSYGNTYIPNGAETVVFGAHSFQNGGAGTLPGIVFTERTSPQGYFSFAAGATASGAADNAHVNGYVRKYGATAFTFPIGQGTVYRPLITPAQSASTVLGAAYFLANPGSATLPAGAPFPTTNLGAGVSGVSPVEYWDLNGTLATTITLTWNATSDLNTLTSGSASRLIIVGYNPSTSKWENLGQTGLTGTVSTTGTITSAVSFVPNTYSVLTFGSMAMLTATPDAGTANAGSGGNAVTNVAANDVVNGQPATLGSGGNASVSTVGTYPTGITLNTFTGSLSVAAGTAPGSYTVVYQLCDQLTPANCTTTTAQLTVTPAPAPINLTNTCPATTVNLTTALSATNTPPNTTLTFHTGSPATAANKVTDPTSVTTGSYYAAFEDAANSCYSPTSQTLIVTIGSCLSLTPDNGVASSGTGGTAVPNVAANDRLNGQQATLGTGGNATVSTVGTYPAGITLNPATGSIGVAQGTAPGTYTVVYQLCDKATVPTCATTTATITVTPGSTAAPDAGTVSTGTGGTAVANVTTNDRVNGQPATLGTGGNATVATVGTYPAGITLNTTTGSVSVAIGTTPGTYTLVYQLCDKLTTPTCTTTTATITVTPSVTAGPDAGTVSTGTGGTAVANVRTNDIVNGIAATAANSALSVVGTYPAGIALNTTTGSVSVAIGTTPGTYTLVYQLCDLLTPATCATTTATITVTPSVTAAPDAGTVSSGIGGTAANVRANDVVNGVAASSANSTLSVVGTYPPGITLNTTTGSVGVAQGTAPGTYTLVYQLCDLLTPATCATTTATITVTPSVTAAPDAGTVSTGTGGTAVANVRTNDTVNGVGATSANSTLSVVGTYPTGITLNTSTGSVSVAIGTTPGTYTLVYQLCDLLTPATCTTTTATITVTPSVTAGPDAGTVSTGTGGTAVANVTTNDRVNGQPATLGAGGNATVASVGTYPAGITLNTTTGAVSVAVGTTPGTYTLVYQLCDKLTPATCATTTATITVTPSVIANPDAGTVSSSIGGTAASVRANDVVNGVAASGANSMLSVVGTYPPGITLNTSTGSVGVAQGTTPGTYTLVYQLCDLLTPATCTTTTATITVTPSVTAGPDAGTVSSGTGGTAVANVRTNDVVNGVAATSANSVLTVVGTYPTGITLNTTTGSVSVAIGTTPGTYTLVYQLCDLLTPATCTTTTATITVTPSVTAAPDAGTANTGTGGTAVANVRTNDIVNGIAATSANSTLSVVGTYPAGITLNTSTGSVSVAVGTTPGTYTLVYQLCDLLTPATCATTTATITVTPGVTAGPDAGTASAGTGGTAVANVRTNDVVNGVAATSANSVLTVVGTYPTGITLNTTTGSVSVAIGTTPGTYTLVYQLCDLLTPATCTTTTATITVTPSVTAAPDAGTVSSGTGGTAVANVRTNDVVNGVAATAANSALSVAGTYPTGITLNTTTGSVSVAIGTVPGTYTLVYQLCDLLTPATCTTTTATITVTPSVTASPDAGTVSTGTGGTAVANVSANDVVNGQPATLGAGGNATIASVGTYPTGITLNTTTGSVSVAIGTTPGTYTLVYQLCDKLTIPTCTTTTATITVTPSVTAGPDAGTVSTGTGGTAVANVTTNDRVNGQPATLGTGGNATLASVGTYPSGITLNTNTGSVSVAQGTTPGSYIIAYQLCDRLTPATCTTTTATITITPSVTAAPDAGTANTGTGGTAVANVRTNDTVNGVAATAANSTLSVVGTYPAGITLNTTTGSVGVAQGTAPGTYTLVYQLCDLLTPATCATTTATITVTPSVTAGPDAGTVSSGTGGTAVANVRTNDIVNGVAATAANSALSVVGTYPTGITLNTSTGSVSVAIGTTPGAYTLVYQLCDLLTPATCTTITATITVTPSVTAGPDAGTVSSGTGGAAVANVRTNDIVNGVTASSANSTLSVVGTYPSGITLNTSTGSVSVAVGTAPGTYTLVYQLCDLLTPATCATTTATITVTPSVIANPDAGTVSSSVGGTAANVRTNDVVNGVAASSANSTLSMVGTYPVGITLNATTGSVGVAQGTAPGTYTLVYQLCDLLTPATCTTTTATITVTPSVTAAPDAGTANAGTGGTAVANVRTNDVVNGIAATAANSALSVVSTTPGITLNTTTGSVSVAVGTAPGTYALVYQLCDLLTPATCTTTTATITVTPSVTAAPDAGTVSTGTGGTAVANVRTNDTVNGVGATLANSTLSVVGTYPSGITLNTSTGSVSVAVGTTPGTYTLVYQLCDLLTPATCTTTTATITVTPSVTAGPDAGTVSSGTGGAAVANVTTNDLVNGQPVALGVVGNATIASVGTYPTGITLNNSTGSVNVAQGTTPGIYTITYQLCDKLAAPTCTTTTVTITVTPSVVANPDAGTVSSSIGGTAANVRTNDVVNGIAASAANSTLSVVGTYPPGITLNTTSGSVGVAQGTAPGTYTLVYQLCDLLTPANCTTTTATITVTPSVTAGPDAGTVSSGTGGTAVANVRTNDVVNGVAASAANSTLSVVGTYPAGITLNTSTGSVSVAIGTTPGTYTLVYQLCDLLTPSTCATTMAIITVTPSVTAAPDAGTVSTGTGGTAVANVRTNDVVNGVGATAANSVLSVAGTYPAGIALNTSTGLVSVALGTTPGTYTLVYQLCDLLTPATCTTTTATITVTPSVTASPDAGTANAGTGGTAVANVRTNDVVNSAGATAANSALSVVGTYPTGITLNTTTGSVSVAQGTSPGTYTLVYQLCDLLTPATCTTTTATITVTPSVTASPDAGTVSTGTGGTAVANVTTNDVLNGQPATLGAGGNATIASVGTYPAGITLNTNTGSVSVAVGTLPGSYTVGYQLCDRLTPITCSTSYVGVTVLGPDLIIAIGQPAPALTVGQTSTVPITVSNVGLAPTAAPISFTLSIPASVTAPAAFTSNGFSCATSGTLVTCTSPATITNGASTTVLVPITPLPTAAGTSPVISGTVATTVESNPANNTAVTTATPAVVAPDLTIAISQPSPVLAVGQTSNVPVTVSNIGTSPTSGLVGFTLSIPASVTAPAAFTSNGFSCTTSGTLVTCTSSATIINGASTTVFVPITPTSVVANPVLSATVATANESNINNNTATTTISSAVAPDLTVSISQPAPALVAGQTSTVVITVNNGGTAPTAGPVNFTLSVPASVTAPAAFTSNGFSCTTSGTLVTCISSATITNGTSTTVQVPITPLNAAVGTNPVLSVTVATANESNVNNNTAVSTVTTPVAGQPDLVIAIGQPSPALVAGQTSNVPVTLNNIGTAPTAGPVSFTLSIPASVTAAAMFSSNGFSCTTSGTLVACSSPTSISNGAGITVLVPVTPLAAAAGTTPTLTATVATGNESNPANNTTATAVPVNTNVVASPDAGTVSTGTGGTAVANVAANDRVNGAPATLGTGGNATIASVGTYPTGIALNPATGSVSVAIGTTPGTYTLVYQLCDKLTPATCTTTTATITVTPSVTASPDAGTANAGTSGTAVANVRTNDVVNGQPASGANSTLSVVSTAPGITLNTTTGSVSVAQGTSPGTYTLVYQLCDLLTPATCTTAAATITVTPSVTASPDLGTASAGVSGTAVANVRANDVVNGLPASGANSTLSVVSTAPGITLNTSTGSVSVAQGTSPGTYTLVYQLCDLLTPATCTTAAATITVTPSVTATPDLGTASAGTGGTAVANVRTNDVVNGIAATSANSTLSVVSTTPGITLNTNTGSVSVAQGTAPGTYTLVYQLCDLLTPATCATTAATITVTPSVTATPDAGSISTGTGGTPVANVRGDDTVNGVAATSANSALSVVGTYPTGITLNTSTGSVSVAIGTSPGTYTLVYQLCDLLTPATCTTTTATITVTPGVTAMPDMGTAGAATGGVVVANVVANDMVNGSPASLGVGGNATIASVGTYPPGITFNPNTGSVSVAIGTTPGSYTVAYQLCDKLTPTTCSTATVTVAVIAGNTASADAGSAPASGGVAVGNVAANDIVNGQPATLGTGGNATIASVGTYPPGITLNTTTGSVSVAQGTSPGSYTVAYQLCDKLTPATCTTTTATITVTPSVTAAPDAGTVSTGTGGTAVANVRTNDVVNGSAATSANSTLSVVGTYPTGITLNTTTGSVSVAIGTTPGTYALVYQLCDLLTPATCTTTTATITVTPSVTAGPDAGTVSSGTGGTAVANVRINDTVNGVAASAANSVLSIISTAPGLSLNTNTGSLTVAQGTAPGTYTLVYQLCDLLTPTTCTTAIATITVTPSVTAAPDAGTVSAGMGGVVVANVAANDGVNGLPASLGAGGNATIAPLGTYPPGISLNTNTGSVSVSAGTTPGSYSLAYQLCDKLSPTTCATTTLVVTVTSSLTAVADGATLVGGASVTIPILANDRNPDGSPVTDLSRVTLPLVSTPTKGQVVVNPDGSLSYTANIGSSGSEVLVYSLCDRVNPGQCSSATVTIAITANVSVVLSPKVYLQGALFGVPASNPLMRDDLRIKGYVPLSSPYAAQGMIGITPVGPTTSSVLSVTGSQAVVDWVFVELRSPASNTVVVDSRPALVLRSGDIVEVDGVSSLSFSAAQSGSYFVVVRHRNHLGVMSGQAVALSYTATVVDFRQASTLTYNLDASKVVNQPRVVVDQGVALWAGNALVDKEVIYQGAANDVNVISQQVINAAGNVFVNPSFKLRGYYTGDINLNGEVIFQGTGNDVDFIYQNIIKNHPGNTLKQNFFKIREQLP